MTRPLALPSSTARTRPLALRIAPTWVLAGLVGVSFAARAAVAFAKQTPTYFPDEYLYSALARSVAETGRPLIRGVSTPLPSLLEPFLTAPAWLIGDTRAAYLVAQVISAAAMSLAAVPVYALARRAGVGAGAALGAAAFALCLPAMLYATTLVAEPFAYPLALGAFAAGTAALATGARRDQILFVALAAAAAFARVQLLVIPLAFAVAVVLFGLRRREFGAVVRRHAWVVATLVAPLAVALARPGTLGVYGSQAEGGTASHDVLTAAARNGLVLLYASGWLLVPGAVIGLAVALTRPRSTGELAFGALALPFGLGVLLQASIWGETDRVQERYYVYALPLLAAAFALAVDRGWPHRRAYSLVAGGMIAAAATFPLSGYAAATMKEHSPTLTAVSLLEEHTSVASGALAVTIVATVLSLVALGLPSLPGRQGLAAGLVIACACCAALAAGATSVDVRNSDGARMTLPHDRSWVDDAHLGRVTFLRDAGSRGDAFSQLIWNRSVRSVVLLPGAKPLDAARSTVSAVGPDGTVTIGGMPMTGPLLVDAWSAAMTFRDANVVGSSAADVLLVPRHRVQLASRAVGFYRDGTLAGGGAITVWPARPDGMLSGSMSFRITAPAWFDKPVTLTVTGGAAATVTVRPGESHTVTLPVCGSGIWKAELRADRVVWSGGRVLSLRATAPAFRVDAMACGETSGSDPKV